MWCWNLQVPPCVEEGIMSHPLLEYIHARFREHFGAPNATLARDSQWSLRGHADVRAPSIFVLVNGSHEKPAAWIFDPYDGVDGVWKCSIGEEADVEKSIEEIRRRLKIAAKWQMNGSADGVEDAGRERGEAGAPGRM
jgi:hypothetical protein